MYNPLFLYGPAGVGKSHMIAAIGAGLKKALADARVILTSGTRLAGAATLAAADNKLPELEAELKAAKALLVDDLHLLAVNDKNQAFLGQIFAHYFKSGLQVVFTSLYPARSLASMEEALKISLAKGWSVDLKAPAAEPRRDMMTSAFSRAGVEFTQDEVSVFMDKIADKQADCKRWAKRLLTIKALREAVGEPTPMDKILSEIFTSDAGPEGQELPTAPEIDAAAKFAPPPPGKTAKNLAIFLPKAHEALMTWVVSRFHETRPPYDKELSYRHVLLQTYDADQPFGIPFQIGEAARLCGADAVLLVGPPLAAALAAKAGDFAHAVGHIVESQDVAFSWIPPGGLLSKANFFRAHLDFQAGKTE